MFFTMLFRQDHFVIIIITIIAIISSTMTTKLSIIGVIISSLALTNYLFFITSHKARSFLQKQHIGLRLECFVNP